MAIDLPPDHDLTLIFERDDVRDAFAAHCGSSHDVGDWMSKCPACHALVIQLAIAVMEWQQICTLSAVSQLGDGLNLSSAHSQANSSGGAGSRSPLLQPDIEDPEAERLKAAICKNCGFRADRHTHLFGTQQYLCPSASFFKAALPISPRGQD